MANKNYDVLNDVKKQKNNDFLTNLSKERTRQNTALSMSNSSSSETIKTTPAVTDTYKANRYEVEKQTPSNDTKALQTSLNDFGYVGKDNKPLKVDGAYGPNTDHAFNTAWKNNEQVIKNNELAKARDKVAEAINNAYEPLMDDAETRKWNMSKADIEKTQNLLNDFGYTDWQGNKLKVDGILGPKTRGALEKHIQDGTPKQEVFDMQKLFNEIGITDKDGNTLKPDGKLGVKTDSATHKAVKQYGNVTEQEPVRGDRDKITDKEYNTPIEIDMSSSYVDILANDKKQTDSENHMSNEFYQMIKTQKKKTN